MTQKYIELHGSDGVFDFPHAMVEDMRLGRTRECLLITLNAYGEPTIMGHCHWHDGSVWHESGMAHSWVRIPAPEYAPVYELTD